MRIIKGWHDARLPAKFLLLGSSSLDLLDQAAESLTGRNRKLVPPTLTPPPARCVSISRRNCGPS